MREGACIGVATMPQPWTLRLILVFIPDVRENKMTSENQERSMPKKLPTADGKRKAGAAAAAAHQRPRKTAR